MRGKSAAPAALSTVNNPTVMLNTAMNPAVLNTAKNAVVTTLTSLFTLIPLVCRSPRTSDRGTPLFAPSGRAVSTAAYFLSFAEHDFARHKILNKGLTLALAVAGFSSMHVASADAQSVYVAPSGI